MIAGFRELESRRLCSATSKLSILSWSWSIFWISKLASEGACKQALAALAVMLRLVVFFETLFFWLAGLR